MKHILWVLGGIVFIIAFVSYLWLAAPSDFLLVKIGKLFAILAVILFLINVNMFSIFTTIKKAKNRNIKIFFAKLSRKIFKHHIPIAISGTTLILIHVATMLAKKGPVLGYNNLKMVTGYLAFLILTITLTAGYFRYHRASNFRRKFHLYAALTFAVAFIIHIFR